jgi:hypothetical protein
VPEELQVVDIQVSPPRLEEPDIETGERRQWVDILITVQNTSRRTLYVISSLRSLRYDRATGTLFIGLSEPESIPQIRPMHVVPPSVTAIAPQESAVIKIAVPLQIIEIKPSTTLGLRTETFDVTGLQRIASTVAYGETPFYPRPTDSLEEMHRRLRSWATTVERTVERTLPPAQTKGPEHQGSG